MIKTSTLLYLSIEKKLVVGQIPIWHANSSPTSSGCWYEPFCLPSWPDHLVTWFGYREQRGHKN